MITVAVISPFRSLQRINDVIEKYEFNCHFHRYIYNHLTDIDDIYMECRDHCDVIFFSGELGYHYIHRRFPDNRIPCAFTGYGTIDILAILLHFVTEHRDIPLNRLYIDFLTPYNQFMDLPRHLASEQLPYFFEDTLYDYDHITARAQQLWEEKKIDMVITRSINNLARFEELGIPYLSVFPSEEMIRDSIERTLDDLRLRGMDSQEHLSFFIRLPAESSDEQEEQEYRMATLNKLLVDYRRAKEISFSIHAGINQFDISSVLPAGSFTAERAADLLRKLTEATDMPLRVGIGLHADESRSFYYAEQALLEAVRYGHNDGFFISGDAGVPSKPLLTGKSTRFRDTHVSWFAHANGINEKNLELVILLFQTQPDVPLTASLLSQRLDVTPRSASRILQKLCDQRLLRVLPDRKGPGKGRPVQCFGFIPEAFRQTFQI